MSMESMTTATMTSTPNETKSTAAEDENRMQSDIERAECKKEKFNRAV